MSKLYMRFEESTALGVPAVDAALTPSAVEAVTPVWPED
jgi:hypothetical protein